MGYIWQMRLWPTLLRVLLIAALALNGAVPAMAAIQMGHGTGPGDTASDSIGSEEAACHSPILQGAAPVHAHGTTHDHASTTAETIVETIATDLDQAPDQGNHEGECCESGTCRCACLHSCPAMVRMVAALPAVMEHASNVGRMPASHVAPALPHLIRPPIR
jgi:hypothetical protein